MNCDILKEFGIVEINIIDHMPTYFIRKKVKSKRPKIAFQGRSYTNLDQEQLSNFLQEFNWIDFAMNDIDTCGDIMFDRIMSAADHFCPIKEFKFSSEKPTWLTNESISIFKERDRCLIQYQKTRADIDKINMRKAINLANISIKMARADNIKEQLNINKNDPKKFWKDIAEIIPNSKSTSWSFSNIHDDDNNIISHENLASHVICFFSDIGVKLDNTIPYIENVIQPTLPYDAHPLERFKPIEEIDLVTEMNKIPVYKPSGINYLPTYILKLCFKTLTT